MGVTVSPVQNTRLLRSLDFASDADVIMTRLRDFFDDNYPIRPRTPTVAPTRPERRLDRSLPSFNAVLMDLGDDDSTDTPDELSAYLREPRETHLEEEKLQDWWIVSKERRPRLFCMAMDLLSIPPMSSENERSFSRAKLVITSQRHRLNHSTVNKLLCLKAWNAEGDFI